MRKNGYMILCGMVCVFLTLATSPLQAKEMETDVVVIGAGSSGLCAALTLAFGGAKVIVLEKNPFPGGSSNFAEGLFAVESQLQKRHRIGLTRDEAFKRHMQNTHWMANARLVRAFIDKSAETIEWLEGLGVEFSEVSTVYPDGPRTWHLVKGLGAGLMKCLVERAKNEKGIILLLETPAEKILMANGKATGVMAKDKEGNSLHIRAKAVIVSAGGYSNSKELMDKYVKGGRYAIAAVPLNQVGGPIKMAWDVGAAPDGMGVMMAVVGVQGERIDSQLWAAGAQPFLWVNKLGERFCDESIFFNFPFAANALANQVDGVGYCVFDDNAKKAMIDKGVQVSLGEFVPVGTKLGKLNAELERGIKEGKAFSGNSLRELAEKSGIKSDALQSTAEEYNQCVKKNYDSIFVKDRRYLQELRTSPFYAIKLANQTLTTMGGIRINYKTEALNEKYEVIPGLYATGNSAAGMYGGSYELETTGGAFGFAVNSGRIAGENTLKYLGQ